MNTNNRNQLAANDIDGVYVCENGSREVLEDMDFYNALATVKPGETIYGNVSGEIAAKIENDYGIY